MFSQNTYIYINFWGNCVYLRKNNDSSLKQILVKHLGCSLILAVIISRNSNLRSGLSPSPRVPFIFEFFLKNMVTVYKIICLIFDSVLSLIRAFLCSGQQTLIFRFGRDKPQYTIDNSICKHLFFVEIYWGVVIFYVVSKVLFQLITTFTSRFFKNVSFHELLLPCKMQNSIHQWMQSTYCIHASLFSAERNYSQV